MTRQETKFREVEGALHRFDARESLRRYADASELPPVPISSPSAPQPRSGPSEEEIRAINEREARLDELEAEWRGWSA